VLGLSSTNMPHTGSFAILSFYLVHRKPDV
jgi:hypothetical protein